MTKMRDTVSGTIVHLRKTSKKLVFFDIEIPPSDLRKTVVVKSWESPEILNRAVKGKDKIHLGDVIEFKGYYESESVFCAHQYYIRTLWSATNPELNFTPRPPEPKNPPRETELLCKHFLNTGRCLAERCGYKHLRDKEELVEKRLEFVKEKKERQLLVHENSLNIEVASSSQRARIFSEWIVEVFGLENLMSGTVLDIAGGRGDLSFELRKSSNLSVLSWLNILYIATYYYSNFNFK